MATKKAAKTSPTGTVENAGNVILIPLHLVTRNTAIAAREGEPDPDKIMQYAENFIERRSNGQDHQISPALVRSNDGETFEIIDGVHRFKACEVASQAGGEPFLLLARVIPANDENALVDAIQSNEFREDASDFDRAASIEKLIALGKTQAQCATIFGLSEGSISQIRKVGKLEAKYRKAVEDGDLERDAAIFIAQLEGDDTARNEVYEECIRHKHRFLDMEAKIETKRLKAEAQEKLDDAKVKVEEAKEEAAAKGTERKAVVKDLKDLDSSMSKTKDVAEKVAIVEKMSKLKEKVDALGQEEAEALKTAEKATKLLEKAKLEKENVKTQLAASKATVTQEDVKAAAKEKGVKTKNGKEIKAVRTKQQLYTELEAMSEDETNPLPTAASNLIGKLQSFMDGEDSAAQLRNAFVILCKTDDQLDAARAAKKRK